MISKFYAGQKVVCMDCEDSDLDLLRCYTVEAVIRYNPDEECELRLEETVGGHTWVESRFEDFDTWASHQKPVSDVVELEQCKIQIAMLQDNKAGMTRREEKLVDALRTIIADYSRNGYGHFQAKLVAQQALEELGL